MSLPVLRFLFTAVARGLSLLGVATPNVQRPFTVRALTQPFRTRYSLILLAFYVPNSAALVLRVLFVASGYLFFYLQSFTGNRQPPFYVPMCR